MSAFAVSCLHPGAAIAAEGHEWHHLYTRAMQRWQNCSDAASAELCCCTASCNTAFCLKQSKGCNKCCSLVLQAAASAVSRATSSGGGSASSFASAIATVNAAANTFAGGGNLSRECLVPPAAQNRVVALLHACGSVITAATPGC